MEKVAFLFCVHNHQPVGNFLHVMENAYQKAYRPFIEVLKKFPFMKVSIHYSGVLWDFFRTRSSGIFGYVEGASRKRPTGDDHRRIL